MLAVSLELLTHFVLVTTSTRSWVSLAQLLRRHKRPVADQLYATLRLLGPASVFDKHCCSEFVVGHGDINLNVAYSWSATGRLCLLNSCAKDTHERVEVVTSTK